MRLIQLENINKEDYGFITLTSMPDKGFSKVLVQQKQLPQVEEGGLTQYPSFSFVITNFEFPEKLEILRGKALGHAAHIEYQLRDFLINYLNNAYLKKDYSKVNKYLENEGNIKNDLLGITEIAEKVSKLDFMKKKSMLSNILKNDSAFQYDKQKTKLLYNYILERNKYGHGLICMLVPEQKFVLRHGAIYNKEFYSLIENKHLDSFIEVSIFLIHWIYKLTKVRIS